MNRTFARDDFASVVLAAGAARRAGPRGGADQRPLANEPDLPHDSGPHGRRHDGVGGTVAGLAQVAALTLATAVGDLGAEGNVARAAIAAAGD